MSYLGGSNLLYLLVAFFIIFVVLVLRWWFGGAGSQKIGKRVGSRSLMTEYAKDLTQLAREGKIDTVVGREEEISQIVRVLSRKRKNNPVLVGKSGVGKTAIVEGLAQRIVEGRVPRSLRDKQLINLDLTSLIAGTKYRGEFEQRLLQIRDFIASSDRKIIVFIDEIHSITNAGDAAGSLGAADILKPSLSRGEFQLLGATTNEEYKKYIATDFTLERRFQLIDVREPSREQTLKILQGIKGEYEKFHGVRITDDTLQEAVNMADKYRPDRYFPDKAIDLIDEACAQVQLDNIEAENSAGVRLIVRPLHVKNIVKPEHSQKKRSPTKKQRVKN